METFPNFDSGLNSNSNDLNFLNFDFTAIPGISESQQRQTTNGNRSSTTVPSTNLTSQPSHNFYSNMLPTPESTSSDAVCPEPLILSPYNMIPSSGQHLTIEEAYKEDEFFLGSPFYIQVMSPQTSPTLSPDATINITSNSLARRQGKKGRHSPISKHPKVSSNNNIRKSVNNINGNNINKGSKNGDNNANGQNDAITNLPSIMTGSPNNLPSDQIAIFSMLELTSPLLDNMIATSIAPSLREAMPNLNIGSNLVSDVADTHSSTNILPNESSSSEKIDPITPSSLMQLKRKQPSSPKSGQNESKSNSQQDQLQQLQPSSKDHTTFIAPTSPTQLNQIRTTNVVATTGAASPSSRKSIRPNTNASSPLALGPSKSPHSLKPTISPNLKPKLPGVIADEVAEQLAKKSNYRSILEGTAQSLGISYSSDVHSSLESRRTTHKAAEQKRRDSLKQSFDELKKVVPLPVSNKSNSDDGSANNNSKSNGNGKSDGKNISKLFLLKRAHDHIVELEQKSKEKDELIQKLKNELDELRGIKRQKIEEKEENANNTKSEDASL